MSMEEIVNSGKGLSRRDFLVGSAVLGGSASVVSALGIKPEEAEAKTWDSVDEVMGLTDEFERYDGYRVAFMKDFVYQGGFPGKNADLLVKSDEDDPDLVRALTEETFGFGITPGEDGYTQLDTSFKIGADVGNNLVGSGNTMGTMSWKSCNWIDNGSGKLVPQTLYGQNPENFMSALNPSTMQVAEEQWEFDNPEQASYAIKKAAKIYGADLVGIAPYDERFIFNSETIFATDYQGHPIFEECDAAAPIDMGFEPKSVIVLAFEMDYEGFKMAASWSEEGVTRTKYSDMCFVSLRLAQMLRGLGYHSYHCGNNASPSVAEAIRAGLGEGGRNSILITEEYGPRVRLAKVYTDCEFAYDKPKTFGVTEFCEVCQVCADTCPSQAITHLSIDDPDNCAKRATAQAGVRKYYLDAQKCYYQWQVVGNDCGMCIHTCPYNKPQTWNHELVKLVTRVPGLNSFARYFDSFFGYGGVPTPEDYYNFWREDL